jgi:hypothetical protein
MHLLELRSQALQLLRLVCGKGEVNVLGSIMAPLLVIETREHLLNLFQLVASLHAQDLVALISRSPGLEVRQSCSCGNEQSAQKTGLHDGLRSEH